MSATEAKAKRDKKALKKAAPINEVAVEEKVDTLITAQEAAAQVEKAMKKAAE